MPTNDGRSRSGGEHDAQGNAKGNAKGNAQGNAQGNAKGNAKGGSWSASAREAAEDAARQSRRETEHDEELIRNEDFDPAEYDTMLTLERLESLEEEMIELDVRTLDDVRRRIAELHHQLDEELTP